MFTEKKLGNTLITLVYNYIMNTVVDPFDSTNILLELSLSTFNVTSNSRNLEHTRPVSDNVTMTVQRFCYCFLPHCFL